MDVDRENRWYGWPRGAETHIEDQAAGGAPPGGGTGLLRAAAQPDLVQRAGAGSQTAIGRLSTAAKSSLCHPTNNFYSTVAAISQAAYTH
jgi:hypothetical protein